MRGVIFESAKFVDNGFHETGFKCLGYIGGKGVDPGLLIGPRAVEGGEVCRWVNEELHI